MPHRGFKIPHTAFTACVEASIAHIEDATSHTEPVTAYVAATKEHMYPFKPTNKKMAKPFLFERVQTPDLDRLLKLFFQTE